MIRSILRGRKGVIYALKTASKLRGYVIINGSVLETKGVVMKNFLLKTLLLLLPICLKAQEPVYFIHGFMRKASSMKKMAKAFQKQDYETHLWGYPSSSQTIEEHSKLLVAELQECAQHHKGEPIHFVTHSLGGIVLRGALNHPDCPKEAKIGKAVLLAPPNQGSRYARFLNRFKWMRKILGQKSGQQLLTTETFDYLGQFPQQLDVLVISGTFGWNPLIKEKNDGKVGISETVLKTPHNQITVLCGHSWMMFSGDVIRHSLDFISKKSQDDEPHS